MKNNNHLKQIMKNCRKRAKIIAVTSGKGGVGKTNISANLAICLAAGQKKVLLIDADFSLGNLDIIMNVNSCGNIGHFLKGRKSIDEIICTGPESVSLICAGSGFEQLANLSDFHRNRLLSELAKLQSHYDVIIIDTAAGISKKVISFCLASDHCLVVTTPQATAMTDAYAMIKVLSSNGYIGQTSVVVNMADSIAEGRKTHRKIASVASRFLNTSVYNAGVLLNDEKLTAAVKTRTPVVIEYPKAKITASLAALATKLGNSSVIKQNEDGFFRKVVNWFV